ncbi:MAG TPA: hypothetical protein VG204_13350 [Terriglobia bacterium]|nr:hypothetical protein [Terriglobia bacterium]
MSIQNLIAPYLAILAYGPFIVLAIAASVNAWNLRQRSKLWKLDRPHCPTASAAQPPSR